MTLRPTDEQSTALAAFATGGSVVIEAGAGTGKSATLVMMAATTPRRGQYVAFNRSIVQDTAARFGNNVAANTAHSLAFRAVGRRYKSRLDNSARMSSQQIARILRIDPLEIGRGVEHRRLAAGFLAGHVLRGVERFCQSADPVPTGEHVPYVDGLDLPQADGRKGWANNRELRRYLAPFLTRAWIDLCQTKGELPFRHSHYLKSWQLSDPIIEADFITIDEAQDMAPVMRAIVECQPNAQLIWVGDSQQELYAFTGAINALAQVKSDHLCYLSQSFRFGPAVADVANVVLERLGSQLRLRGLESIASEVTTEKLDAPAAVLCRTNATTVRKVLGYRQAGKRVHLVGDGSEVLRFARAAQELQQRGSTSHPDLACFMDWPSVLTYVAHDAMGHELRLLVKLVEEFGVPTIESALSGLSREDAADVVVSTAHKFKGKEASSVQLAEDFPAANPEPEPDPEKAEDHHAEDRILYVAVTRAQHVLDLSACPTLATIVAGEEVPRA